jgi:hypothetical protein
MEIHNNLTREKIHKIDSGNTSTPRWNRSGKPFPASHPANAPDKPDRQAPPLAAAIKPAHGGRVVTHFALETGNEMS